MIEQYTIRSAAGIAVDLINVGAAVAAIRVPCGRGERDVIAPGMRIEDFLVNRNYCGATVGRYANRLANARVTVNGIEYRLSANDATGRHCLHGGKAGLHLAEWVTREQSDDAISFATTSMDGDQGFPGRLHVQVDYSVVDGDTLRIEYQATTDAPGVINLTNHCYFNLDGAAQIDRHAIRIEADRFTPTDVDGIPLGVMRPVGGTPLDLREFTDVGTVLRSSDGLITGFSGLDHNFVLNDRNVHVEPAASVLAAESGIRMDVHTSQPGLQFYTANHTQPPIARRGGLCLEAQNFPDAPNQAAFPGAMISPGEVYRQFIEYRFSRERG